jgi:hypothetical protein
MAWRLVAACVLLALSGPRLALSAGAEPREASIGVSAEGRPIRAYMLGDGPLVVMMIGGIHGAPERNASAVVWELLTYFAEEPAAVPSGMSLIFVPEANPDGLANGTRDLTDGVDANRNWPTGDWSPDTFGPGAYVLAGGGGETPLSEPETRALALLIDQVRPIVLLSYHAAAGFAMGGPAAVQTGLLEQYATFSGYPASSFLAYPVTGDLAQWSEDLGIPTVEVELSDHADSEFERNLAGVLAILRAITGVPDPASY